MNKWLLIALMTIATAAQAQQVDLKSLDKFASIAKGVNQINVDESMMKSASNLLDDKKVEQGVAKKTLSNLKGVFIRNFEFENKGAYKFEDLKPLRDQLKAPEWSVIVQSKEPEEQTEIWLHKTNGEADGILLIAAESKELTVINALGIGDLRDLSKIGGQFGVPQIGNKPVDGKD